MGTLDVRELRENFSPGENARGGISLSGIDFSSVDMYLRCAKQYHFRHILGLKRPPGIALLEGTSHHYAVEQDNRTKMKKGKNLKPGALTDLFVERLRLEIPKAEAQCEEAKARFDWEGEDEDALVKRARVLHDEYARNFSPKIDPTGVEETFQETVKMESGDFSLFGAVDLSEKDEITDYKVVGRAKTERDAADSLQLSTYAWALKRKRVRFISFVKAKNPYVAEATAIRTKGELVWALEVIKSAVDSIRRGAFPVVEPGVMNWICQPKFCGYWDLCRGKKT